MPARTGRGARAGRVHGDRRVVLAWAALVLAPILVLVARVAGTGPHVYLNGDLALIDVQAHRAAAWQLTLGPYDRYGWHHPGPVYLYLVSFVERALGQAHGAQAEAVTALLVNGLALAGVVYVVGRHLGPRAAAGAAAVGLVLAAGMGPLIVSSAWNPYVVILPLLLCGTLAALAMLGSATALCAAALVGTFAVQSDIGTVPFVVLVVGWAGVALAVRARRGRPVEGSAPAAAVLLVLTAACWIPVVYQQVTGPRGNVAAVARFLLHQGHHAGVVTGASAAGYALVAPLRLFNPGPPASSSLLAWLATQVIPHRLPGLAAFLVVAVLAGWLLVAARRRGEAAAGAVALVGVLGLAAALAAGAAIVGLPFRWLMAWAGAVTGLLLLAAALVVAAAPVLERVGVRRALAGAVVAGGVALVAVAAVAGDGLVSDPTVRQVWSALQPVVGRQAHPVVGLTFDTAGAGVAGGVEDQLVLSHVPFTVAPRWENQFTSDSSAPPTMRIGLTAGAPPAGFRRLGTVGGVVVSYEGGPMSSST